MVFPPLLLQEITQSAKINGNCPNSDSIQLTVLHQPEVHITDPGVVCSNQLHLALNSNLSEGPGLGITLKVKQVK